MPKDKRWVGTWAASPAPADGGAFSNQTLRMASFVILRAVREVGVQGPGTPGFRFSGGSPRIYPGEQRFSVAKKRSHNNSWALAPGLPDLKPHG